MEEVEWKIAFIGAMQANGRAAAKVAQEEADYQWMTAPNVESLDPVEWANKVARAYN